MSLTRSRIYRIAQQRQRIIKLEAEAQIEAAITQEDLAVIIDRLYSEGGKPFVEAVKQYGVNEKGEPARLPRWYQEVLQAIGDFRIRETYTSGIAQYGKTLSHTWLICYTLTELGLNTLWSYDQLQSLNIQVPSNFRPVIEGSEGDTAGGGWLAKRGLQKSRGPKNNQLYQVDTGDRLAIAQFIYVSTSRQIATKQGGASAGSIAVGVSRDLLVEEEFSQYPPGAGDVPKRRLDASRLPNKPIRYVGTPGGGQGIEKKILQADYQFYPHYKCSECSHEGPMDPFGCLLKPVKRADSAGNVEKMYLNDAGRPEDWFHHDELDPVNTAYFGCPECGAEIPKSARADCWNADIKTGIPLTKFLDDLPSGIPERDINIGIEISPLSRIEKVNTAADIIRDGINTGNPNDWCEQRLGKPSVNRVNNITISMMESAIGAPPPDRDPDFTLASGDLGRNEDWFMVGDVYLPINHEDMPLAQKVDRSILQIKMGGAIIRSQIPDLLNLHGVHFGVIDSEPDIPSAASICRDTVMVMADQKTNTAYQVRKGERQSGGIKYKCWDFRYSDFQDHILNSLTLFDDEGYPLLRFPGSWQKWLTMPEDVKSPIRHFCSMTRDPETKKWVRPSDHIDDLFFTMMFMRLALFLHLKHGGSSDGGGAFTTVDEQEKIANPSTRIDDFRGNSNWF